MKSFTQQPNPSTSVVIIPSLIPNVIINKEALIKMLLFVDNCQDEIGWLGIATKSEDKNKNIYYIEDVILFEQDVHSSTTEITPEGLSKFGEQLLEQPNGIEMWNNIRVWGHSHINMDVLPSTQDNEQMGVFAKSGHDWFIRIIANKQGKLKVDLYDYIQGIAYLDVPWVENLSQEEVSLYNEISVLEEKINSFKNELFNSYEQPIKDEIKTKVRTKLYATTYNWYGNNYYGNTNSNSNNKVSKNFSKPNQLSDNKYSIYNYFDYHDLIDIGYCASLHCAKLSIQNCGYNDGFFTDDEIDFIWSYGVELNNFEYNKGRKS